MMEDFRMSIDELTSEELYSIRERCDRAEEPNSQIDIGLCYWVSREIKSTTVGYHFIASIFEPTFEERQEYPGHSHRHYLGDEEATQEENLHMRIVAAGFLACLIDDELIARGD